jgi:ribosomal protein S18 acetylase RimI-like enzyme
VEQTRALRRQVLRPHQTEAEVASHEPPEAYAVGAFDGDELVAVGLIGREGDSGEWRVRGMATKPARRGRGAGTAVLRALLDHAREEQARAVWCQARTTALGLYERAGFEVDSEEFELPEIGPHVRMRLALGYATG